ncbi:hypothetical protein ACFQ9J_15880 [Streptomyces sp. NPDC056529]
MALATMADDPDGTYGAWLAELGLSEAISRWSDQSGPALSPSLPPG